MKLIRSGKFHIVRPYYKHQEDMMKYGFTFDALTNDDELVVTCLVNGERVQAHRIIEEYGQLLFIHNFKQKEYNFDEVVSLEIL